MPTGVYERTQEMRDAVSMRNKILGIRPEWPPGPRPPTVSGPDHPNWKGDKVSYRSLHYWVQRHLGKPKKCEDCGITDLRPRQYHWANISGKYMRDLSDWKRLCVKCHRKFDKTK